MRWVETLQVVLRSVNKLPYVAIGMWHDTSRQNNSPCRSSSFLELKVRSSLETKFGTNLFDLTADLILNWIALPN